MAVDNICDLPGSPKFHYTTNGGITATRVVQCPWVSWRDYATELAPLTIVIGTEVVQKPGATLPHLPSLRVTAFDMEPYYGERDAITTEEDDLSQEDEPFAYKFAKFTISYGAPTAPQSVEDAEGIDPVPFLEHRLTSGGQLLDVAADSQWKWNATGSLVDADAQKLSVMVATTQHSVFWPRVIQPNFPNLENFKGHVNNAAFTLRGYEYPAGTLMYLNYDLGETVLTDGSTAYNITLNFEGKRVHNQNVSGSFDEYGGHNHYWNKDFGAWDKVVGADNAARSPFPTEDFLKLFEAAA